MNNWERIKQIIAFYQSFPHLEEDLLCYMLTIRSKSYEIYKQYTRLFSNPINRETPFDIIEDTLKFLDMLQPENLDISVLTTLYDKPLDEKLLYYEEYLVPTIEILRKHWNINQIEEKELDLFSLRGLYPKEIRKYVNEAMNTVIYV